MFLWGVGPQDVEGLGPEHALVVLQELLSGLVELLVLDDVPEIVAEMVPEMVEQAREGVCM